MTLRPRTLKTTLGGVNQNTYGATTPQKKMPSRPQALPRSLKGSSQRREGHVQLGAETRKRGDDGNRHASCDQRVFSSRAKRARSLLMSPALQRPFGMAASQSPARFDIVAQFAKIER